MNSSTANKTAASPWGRTVTPSFFNPDNAGLWGYRPNVPSLFNEAQTWKKSIRPALADQKRFQLLLIDVQRDFCFPEGTLYVAGRSGTGAIDDSRRMAEFIYRNLGAISRISCTLDTHVPFQIFSRSFWVKADDTPVDAFTTIAAEDIRKGVYKPAIGAAGAIGVANYQWLMRQCLHYCEELERAGKYQLYIWPEHCLLGSEGHTLVGLIEEAAFFHSYVRGMQADFQIKGAHPLTENYSVLRPEVSTRFDGVAIGQKNVGFIKTLLDADYVAIAGQAASHCVKSSIDDLLDEILANDPALARKVYVMEDCMSAVTVQNPAGGFYADFTGDAETALKRFADAGMHVVKSTDPLDSWPDLIL